MLKCSPGMLKQQYVVIGLMDKSRDLVQSGIILHSFECYLSQCRIIAQSFADEERKVTVGWSLVRRL